MAYETSTAANMADLVTAITTFVGGLGWSVDQLDTGAGKAAISNNKGVWVSFRWEVGVNTTLGIYQALGFDPTQDPGNHPEDDGGGVISGTAATIATGRCITGLGTGPYVGHHFFGTADYFHMVLEPVANEFRHAGCGKLVLPAEYTALGMEYAYGQAVGAGGALSADASVLLDGLCTSEAFTASLHVRKLPQLHGSIRWGLVGGLTGEPTQLDRGGAGKAWIQGGARGGLNHRAFGWLPVANSAGAFVPLVPVTPAYLVLATTRVQLLPHMPDVAMLNIQNFAVKEEITQGPDTWMVFPTVEKDSASTANQGIAYRKVVE